MSFLRTLWEGWKIVAHKIGNFQARLLVGLVYFLIVPPFAIIVKAARDPLRLRETPISNWTTRQMADYTLDASARQF